MTPDRLAQLADLDALRLEDMDKSGLSDPPLLLAVQVVGADRIIFSVDYPFSMNEQGRKFLDNASISPADREKISHLNAERLLRLEAELVGMSDGLTKPSASHPD